MWKRETCESSRPWLGRLVYFPNRSQGVFFERTKHINIPTVCSLEKSQSFKRMGVRIPEHSRAKKKQERNHQSACLKRRRFRTPNGPMETLLSFQMETPRRSKTSLKCHARRKGHFGIHNWKNWRQVRLVAAVCLVSGSKHVKNTSFPDVQATSPPNSAVLRRLCIASRGSKGSWTGRPLRKERPVLFPWQSYTVCRGL